MHSPSSDAQPRQEGAQRRTRREVDGMAQAVYGQRKYRQGEVLCKKGETANEMFLTVSGNFLVTEFGIELPPEVLSEN
jgi:hypothetical protein